MNIIILGLGNPLMCDDSAGIRVARVLQKKLDNTGITVMEASVAGLDVLDLLAGFDKAVIIDAIQTASGRAGEIYRLDPEAFRAARQGTPHGIDFLTAFELARKLRLALPAEIVIFAIAAADTATISESCTPEVEKAIPRCVEMVLRELGISACC